jgi:hypothetical protein
MKFEILGIEFPGRTILKSNFLITSILIIFVANPYFTLKFVIFGVIKDDLSSSTLNLQMKYHI